MRKLLLPLLCTGLIATSAGAQTLFTYGGNPVSKQEFLRVYQKNSLNKKPDYSAPALREYLDLYSLFKMKVREADNMRLDTTAAISAELDNYRRQLAKNYLTDKEVTNRLSHEAYDRMKQEVHIAHILISCSQNALPADTLAAYHKADSLLTAITKGKADFATLARQYSDDRGTRETGGDIGYLTALQTLYVIENAAYTTPVGKVSGVIRTQFGYHIVKVLEKRPARGEVQVAQILIAAPKSKGEAGIAAAKLRADSVEQMLKRGVPFDTLVNKYSDDKFSLSEHGVLAPFGVGKMTPAFENAAFGLKKPGDVSQPVQTEYGWHIVKLMNHTPLKPYDSMESSLRRRIENDSRAGMAHDMFIAKIKAQHGFKEYPQNIEPLTQRVIALPDTGQKAGMFKASDFASMNAPVFEMGGTIYRQSDLMTFAEGLTRGRFMGPRAAVMNDIYHLYVDRTVNDFEEHHLADENVEFKNLMEEYRNGIMLFELMDRNVWGKAGRDSVGLKTYYGGHQSKYNWEPGFTGAIYKFRDQAALDAGLKLLNKNAMAKDETIYKAMNTESTPDAVSIQRGHYEFSKFPEVSQASIMQGKPSPAVKSTDGSNSFTVVVADKVYNGPSPKTLDEARGYVVAEYQDVLEKDWNAQLRAKYPVKVDEAVFKSMVK